jgi:hypothetical protein
MRALSMSRRIRSISHQRFLSSEPNHSSGRSKSASPASLLLPPLLLLPLLLLLLHRLLSIMKAQEGI